MDTNILHNSKIVLNKIKIKIYYYYSELKCIGNYLHF